MMYLNKATVLLYQTFKNLLEIVQYGLLIPSEIMLLIFQTTIPKLVEVIPNYQKN